MTIIEDWRRRLREQLRSVAGDVAPHEVDRIIGDVVGAGPTELTLRRSEQLNADQELRLERLVADRLTGRPLAYVLGHVDFFGLDLLCDERALIPRPETEELVEVALKYLPEPRPGVEPVVIDVGTGSGNIALALASQRPDLRVIATDVSWPALSLARENRERLKLDDRVQFLCGRTMTMFHLSPFADMVISNPPYVVPGDPALQRAVVDHEPEAALYAGPAGTEIIAELIAQSPAILRQKGLLVCEIGFGQGADVVDTVHSVPGWGEPKLHRDLAGIERILVVRRGF